MTAKAGMPHHVYASVGRWCGYRTVADGQSVAIDKDLSHAPGTSHYKIGGFEYQRSRGKGGHGQHDMARSPDFCQDIVNPTTRFAARAHQQMPCIGIGIQIQRRVGQGVIGAHDANPVAINQRFRHEAIGRIGPADQRHVCCLGIKILARMNACSDRP